jgi:hypothetical protein
MNLAQLMALTRALFLGWKVTGSKDPKWAEEREFMKGFPAAVKEDFKENVIGPFKHQFEMTPKQRAKEWAKEDAEHRANYAWWALGFKMFVAWVIIEAFVKLWGCQ